MDVIKRLLYWNEGKTKHTSSIQEIMRVSGALCQELRAEKPVSYVPGVVPRLTWDLLAPESTLIASTSHYLSFPPIPRMRMMGLPGSPKGLLYELCCLDLSRLFTAQGPEGLVIHTKQTLGLGPMSQGFLLCYCVFPGLLTFPRRGGRA